MPGMYKTGSDGSDSPPPGGNMQFTVQSWSSGRGGTPSGGRHHGNHVRSDSIDSLDSNSSGSSGFNHSRQLSGDSTEFIPTRTVPKASTQPAHNPLRFVKVQSSSLYLKAEEQLKLAKEIKISRQKLRDEEEEWQSNLDSWKSRRKKHSEKTLQRVEVMREIEEQEKQQHQRKIKTFSEMMEERANKPRSYNFAIYQAENEEKTSKSDFVEDKEDKSTSGLDSFPSESETEGPSEEASNNLSDRIDANENGSLSHKYSQERKLLSYPEKVLLHSDFRDDSEVCSSEEEFITERRKAAEELGLSAVNTSTDSGLESLGRSGDVGDSVTDFGQENSVLSEKIDNECELSVSQFSTVNTTPCVDSEGIENVSEQNQNKELVKLQIWLKHSPDSKGFGFSLRGGKDQGTPVFVDSVTPGGASDIAGLKVGDEIREINGESCYGRCHSALVFAVKQAVYTGLLDLVIKRASESGGPDTKDNQPLIISRRGSAFAQRIAMFNNTTDVQSSQENQKSEPYDFRNKGDSIVLRRRSTFESVTQNKEQTTNNRWSTSVTRDSYSGGFSVQDRKNSFESFATMDHSIEIKPFTTKKLPPPVPAKPKSRMSTSIESLHDTTKETPLENNEINERKNICLESSQLSETEILTPVTPENVQLNEVSEELKIEKSNEDKNIETLKELCENYLTKSSSPVSEQKIHSDILTTEEEIQIHSINKENELQNDLKPCGYTVKVEGDMNIVYESHSNEPSEIIYQKDNLEESKISETFDSLNIPDDDDNKDVFINELNNEVCNLPDPLIDDICKENEKIEIIETENGSYLTQVQLTSADIVQCENMEAKFDDDINEDPLDAVNESELLSHCNYIESNNTQSSILTPVDDIAEQMELMILNQLAQQNDNVEVAPDDLELYLDNQQLLLNNFDTLPRQFEPPKEKPPPPPTEETEPLKITVTSVARTNSTKRIKQEIQKRRSDFLGLEIHDDGIDIDNYIPSPVAVEDILRSEIELKLCHEPGVNNAEKLDDPEFIHPDDLVLSNFEMEQCIPNEFNDDQIATNNLNLILEETNQVSNENIFQESSYINNVVEEDSIIKSNEGFCQEPDLSCENSEAIYVMSGEAVEESLNNVPTDTERNDSIKNEDKESGIPQPMKRQHLLLSLGAAPKAKIIQEGEWIRQNEKIQTKRLSMPILEGSIYDTTPWHKENSGNKSETSSPEKATGNRSSLPPLSFDSSHKFPPIPPPKPSNKSSPINEETNSSPSEVQTVHYVISPVSDSSEDSDCNSASGYSWNYEQIQPPDSREMSENQQPKPNELCGVCSKELGFGEVIVVDTVLLPYHSDCFNCSICNTELNSQSSIQYLNNNLACQTCIDTRNAHSASSPGESSSRL